MSIIKIAVRTNKKVNSSIQKDPAKHRSDCLGGEKRSCYELGCFGKRTCCFLTLCLRNDVERNAYLQ